MVPPFLLRNSDYVRYDRRLGLFTFLVKSEENWPEFIDTLRDSLPEGVRFCYSVDITFNLTIQIAVAELLKATYSQFGIPVSYVNREGRSFEIFKIGCYEAQTQEPQK